MTTFNLAAFLARADVKEYMEKATRPLDYLHDNVSPRACLFCLHPQHRNEEKRWYRSCIEVRIRESEELRLEYERKGDKVRSTRASVMQELGRTLLALGACPMCGARIIDGGCAGWEDECTSDEGIDELEIDLDEES